MSIVLNMIYLSLNLFSLSPYNYNKCLKMSPPPVGSLKEEDSGQTGMTG